MFRNILNQSIRSTRAFSTSRIASRDVARFSAIGRIGADLEKLTGPSGKDYLKYPLAVSTSKDEVSWFKIVVFDDNAVNFMTSYLKKGQLVYVEADASVSHYEADGAPRASLRLIQQSISPVRGNRRDAANEEKIEETTEE